MIIIRHTIAKIMKYSILIDNYSSEQNNKGNVKLKNLIIDEEII